MTTVQRRSEAFLRGFASGNYDGAYASNDGRPPCDDLVARGESIAAGGGPDYADGYVLGWYSCYETCEVPHDDQNLVRDLRARYEPPED